MSKGHTKARATKTAYVGWADIACASVVPETDPLLKLSAGTLGRPHSQAKKKRRKESKSECQVYIVIDVQWFV